MKPDNFHNNIMVFIRRLGRPVFTTHELSSLSGRSASTIIQCLNRLVRQGLIIKIYRGVWAETAPRPLSAFEIIPWLFPLQRVYVSFISALHLHGMIEQIPGVITIASTSHSSRIRTNVGTLSVHQLVPELFDGFDWYKGDGRFLIAEPEKALIDSLYLSGRRKKQFRYLPELHLPADFSIKKAVAWAGHIQMETMQLYVLRGLKRLIKKR